MKTEKAIAEKVKLPENIRINPDLAGKYDDQPLFNDKVDRASHTLKAVGLPKI